MYPVKSIPDKLFFKIGEVCELVEVQPHVLRYWESEFPMLTPQKNRAGQRTYRRRDVEIIMRIKQLLYDEGFTIAGAKKKLSSEMRGGTKLKIVTPDMIAEARPMREAMRTEPSLPEPVQPPANEPNEPAAELPSAQQQALRTLKQELRALLTMLSRDEIISEK